MSLQSQAYQMIKDLDPYHPTVGAVNCGESWQFTDTAPSFLSPQTSILSRQLPQAQQPALQLSLDVVMHENYHQALEYHAGGGSWAGGLGSDGNYRFGVRFVRRPPAQDPRDPLLPVLRSAGVLCVLTTVFVWCLSYRYVVGATHQLPRR